MTRNVPEAEKIIIFVQELKRIDAHKVLSQDDADHCFEILHEFDFGKEFKGSLFDEELMKNLIKIVQETSNRNHKEIFFNLVTHLSTDPEKKKFLLEQQVTQRILLFHNVVEKKAAAADLFATEEMAQALVKMADGASDDPSRIHIAAAIRFIIHNATANDKAADLFATEEMAKALVKMANETNRDLSRQHIAGAIGAIIKHATTKDEAADLFATEEMAKALVKMANETNLDLSRQHIAFTIVNITQHATKKDEAADLFATEEMAKALVKMANETNLDLSRQHIAFTIVNITQHATKKKEVTALFATEEMAQALVKMANETEDETARSIIAAAISNIIYNATAKDKAADLFATEEMAQTLVKMANETRNQVVGSGIAALVFCIIYNATKEKKAEVAALFATEEMAQILVEMANEADDEIHRADHVAAICIIIQNAAPEKKAEVATLFATKKMTDPIKKMIIISLVRSAEEYLSTEGLIKIIDADLAESYIKAIEYLRSLGEAIDKYNVKNKGPRNNFKQTQDLFKRLLTELTVKEGLDGVLEDAGIVLEFLNKNPKYLELFVEEIASHSLEACVNQPIFGWFKIYSLVAIGRATTITDKIEAAKFSLIVEEISELVSKDKNFTWPNHQVEGVNIMIAMFCQKVLWRMLPKKEYWSQIAEIQNAEAIPQEWIDKSSQAIWRECETLLTSVNHKDLLDKILIGNRAIVFIGTALPDKMKEYEEKAAKEKEELSYLVNLIPTESGSKKFSKDELLQLILAEEEKEELSLQNKEDFAEKYKDNGLEELMALYNATQLDLALTKDREELIAALMEEITKEPPRPDPSFVLRFQGAVLDFTGKVWDQCHVL